MKTYPTISSKPIFNQNVFAFDKLDGSNIRAEWSRKRGFYKYGSRRRLVGADERPLGLSINLINDLYGDELSKRLLNERVDSAVCYFEFSGPNSFAGVHDENDNFDVVLFDVSLYKKGFIKFTNGLSIPKLIHRGNINDEFISNIRAGQIDGVTFEGVVCKYFHKNQIHMFKIKSQAWFDKLRERCDGNDELYEQLK